MLLLGLLAATPAAAGEWTLYPESNFILDLAVDSTGVWAATPGGVTHFAPDGAFLGRLTALDGLPGTAAQAVARDAGGDLWIGTLGGGALRLRASGGDRWLYRPEDGLFSGVVTAVAPVPGGVWIATDAGVAKFLGDEREAEGRSRYSELYGLLADSVLAVAEHGGSVWFGTSRGISRLDENLVFSAPSMVPAPPRVNAFAVHHDTLWAAGANGPYRREASGFFRRNTGLSGAAGNVRDLAVVNDTLWAATGTTGGVFFWSGSVATGWIARNDGLFTPGTIGGWASGRALGSHPAGGTWVGTDRGLARRVDGSWQRVVADGPPSNFLVSIAEDEAGGIWFAAGADGNLFKYGTEPWAGARGAGRLLDGAWTNFDRGNSGLASDNCYRLARGADDEMYVGTWGSGLFRYRAGAAAWDTLQPPPPLDTTLVDVVADLALSSDGTLWVAGYTKGLGALTAGGEWFPYLPGDGIPDPEAYQYPRALAVQGGTVWLGTYGAEVAGLGTARLETRRTYDDKDDDALDSFPPSSGWTSVEGTVFDLLLEPNGTLWAATAAGVARYAGGSWTSFLNGAPGRALGQVRGIARDAAGSLWFATGSGLAVRDAAGTWTHYDAATSDLPGNDVTAVHVEGATGDIWVTVWGGGAARFRPGDEPQVEPAEPARRLASAPNPFRPAGGGSVAFLDAEPGSVVRIYTLGGTLVRELPSGGDPTWDGRDAQGRTVPSGIYLVTAQGPGGSVLRGNLAVVR